MYMMYISLVENIIYNDCYTDMNKDEYYTFM